jgi:hypothetical protein
MSGTNVPHVPGHYVPQRSEGSIQTPSAAGQDTFHIRGVPVSRSKKRQSRRWRSSAQTAGQLGPCPAPKMRPEPEAYR